MRINHLALEVTRRCNIQCSFCLRGHQQRVDISLEQIDILLDQTTSIGHFCPTGGEPSLNVPAIQYFINGCKKRGITIDTFYIATNGIRITNEFVNVCIELYDMSKIKDRSGVQISNDYYHLQQGSYDDSLLKDLHFFSKREKENDKIKWKLHHEGLAITNHPTSTKMSVPHPTMYYINVHGNVINGCDWSYENQEKNILCRVENLEEYDTMGYVKEDFERIKHLDKMYLMEVEQQMIDEWMEWEAYQKRKPAEIKLKIKKAKHEIKR